MGFMRDLQSGQCFSVPTTGKRCNFAHVFVTLLTIGVCANPNTPCAEGDTAGSGQPALRAAAVAPEPEAIQFRHAPPTPEELDKLLKSGFATQVKVDRILVPAIVTDSRGKPIVGLTRDDFRVKDNTVPQQIDFFDVSKTEPVSLAFLLDVSGSMRLLDKIGESREAIRFFLDGLEPADKAALLTFADDEVQTIAPMGTRPEVLLAGLQAVKAYGQTALNDAIAAAPGVIAGDYPGRKAVILITDGIDNASHLSLLEATSVARRSSVPIYTIGFSTSSVRDGKSDPETGTNADVLRRISAETGGVFYWIDDPDELKEAVVAIEEELRSQYVIGYTPPVTGCDGAYRTIDLQVAKDRYRVRARKGYVPGPC
jgi:VWFA-related protein